MKQLFFVFLAAGVFIACDKDEEKKEEEKVQPEKWGLVEILSDPGDGSGTFTPVESDKIVEFYADGTITSNGNLCMGSVKADNPSTGTYSLVDSTIKPSNCTTGEIKIFFEKNDSTMIISYPCIEPCREKYERK